MSNIHTVQQIYEAFGRGDVPAILERLHPEVEWEHDVVDHGIPWVKPRHGRAGAGEFFASLGTLEFEYFEPLQFLEGPGLVFATVRLKATVKATAQRVTDFEGHLFTFNEKGQITRFRHFIDTHQHLNALRG